MAEDEDTTGGQGKHLCEREVGPKEPSWRCHSGFCPEELGRDSLGQAAKKLRLRTEKGPEHEKLMNSTLKTLKF